jgi:SAM-dependent methyltransferase
MESAEEAVRLEAKTQAEETRRQLALVGLAPGMRALDAGAGTGAVAREMAAMVGPTGSVVAFDQSEHRAASGAVLAQAPNLEFATGDLYAPPLPEGSFDFIWCRFVFEYLAEPDLVVARLLRLLKPGGKLVLGDLDGNALFHYPLPPEVERGLGLLMGALEGRFDPYAGRKLFTRMRKAGLADIKVHHQPYHLIAGPATPRDLANWEAKVRTLRPAGVKALGSPEAWDRFSGQFMDLLRDPDALTYSTLFLVEGRRPA